MTVYSIGYGNRLFPDFVELLRLYAFTHVVDVRSVPFSNYQVEFRRERLVDLLPAAGFKYVYMGDTLGGANARAASESEEARVTFELGLSKLSKAVAQPHYKVVLMCGCLLPNKCHRGALLGAALDGLGLEYQHVGRSGELFSQQTLLAELTEAQGVLF